MSSMITPDNQPLLTPEVSQAVLIDPLPAHSIAAQIATMHLTNKGEVRFPRVLKNPETAWLDEGEEINPSAPTLGEIVVNPRKVAGLTVVSNEMLEDSDVPVSQLVGDGLVRDIAHRVDAAFFGNLEAPAPSGLESLGNVGTVDAGAGFSNLDAFEEAIAAASDEGAATTFFVANPADALALATLKKSDGSNESLLSPDPTAAIQRLIAGVPLLRSKHVTAGTVWAIPTDRVRLVVRKDANVAVSDGAFFTSDQVAVRATMRVGFGFISPEAIIKITTSA